MGEISRSITVQIPVEVVYKNLKLDNSLEFREDLLKGSPQIHYTKDIPNNLVAVESSKWFAKIEEEVLLQPLSQNSCQVTTKLKYPRLVSESTIKPFLAQILSEFRTLEFGYKEGKKHNLIPTITACPHCHKQITQGNFEFCPFCGNSLKP